MELTIPMASGIILKFTTGSTGGKKYPTAGLQKGFLLIHEGQDLAEEGVGFGVPILKRGIQTIFAGSSNLISIHKDPVLNVSNITVNYLMNQEEKIVKPGFKSVKNNFLYSAKNFLAVLIRRIPPLRGPLTAASNAVRWIFGWQTTYEEAEFCTNVKVIYSFDRTAGTINVEIDADNLYKQGITEVVLMNEQGANTFDQYCDSNGISLCGDEIGCWDRITSEWAIFVSTSHRLAFMLRQVQGATIFRGRELIGSRLAWSGFGISFPPDAAKLSYQLRIERLK
jgi:hypothetical protein